MSSSDYLGGYKVQLRNEFDQFDSILETAEMPDRTGWPIQSQHSRSLSTTQFLYMKNTQQNCFHTITTLM